MDELEEKFELTRRTLFRDIKALMEGGLPIGGDAGEGYFIVDGYHLPPVVFNKEEASSLLLGAKFLAQHADTETSKTFDEAMTKVKAVLRYTDKEYLENLDQKVAVMPHPSATNKEFPDSHLNAIQTGIASRKTITFEYYSSYNDSFTKREVEPLGLVFYANRWHLMAYCLMRQDFRDFRADRIQKITINTTSFDPDLRPDYMEFAERSLMGTEALEATIRVSDFAAKIMSYHKYVYGFLDEKQDGDWVVMRFSTPSYEFFGRWLLEYTNNVDVIGPQELKTKMRSLVEELIATHK